MEVVSGDLASGQAPIDAHSSGNAGRYARSRQMVNALREEFLYSEKRVRDVIFRVIAGMVGDSCTAANRLAPHPRGGNPWPP